MLSVVSTPPTQAGLKAVFSFAWRGGTRQWSQLYHWTQGSWQDQGHFNALSDAWWNLLKGGIPARNTLVETIAYNPGSFLPVYTKSYGSAGTYTDTSNPQALGEACMLAKFTTDQRTSKNHPIYLFKWFHGVQSQGSTAPDELRSGLDSTMAGNLTTLMGGLSDGTLTRKYCGPFGAVAQASSVNPELHVREFPT
jgi:hypothetical protein